ncbi:hypothetical protein B0H17DRAFT_1159802 [Mycena rosella]|uniref:Uncharacterized protein n=1 Tax=Mycena rosella TaxID=1033263 RepID=A0AAD7GHS3_MYCRO|nr:hypothetical protein B0H17DRAFT_1159802 [Mycena rosella]
MITNLNIHRNNINELGVRRFAEDTSQELVKNFSVDKLSIRAVDKKNGCDVLWSALPSTTNEHIPGCLSLCDQKATVTGWDAAVSPSSQKILDTLFIKLVNPPRDILIPGLPLNVIPLGRTSTHITVLLQDDLLLSMIREQVLCLPNFAMTNYASQGKSRDKNEHKAYYIVLS